MKKRTITSVAAATIFTCLAATPAYSAKLVSADDPEAILDIAKGYGSAELTTDAEGDPKIVGRMKGTRYSVMFYGCDNGKYCDDIQFTASWSGYKVSMNEINTWNKNMRYGKAYLDDDNDPTLEIAVNLNHGVTRTNLDDTFDWWGVALDGFEEDVLKD